tara:strand:+ start:199 stop:399 length:201 start_codon:yes stop_codon:yes gene_type:complete
MYIFLSLIFGFLNIGIDANYLHNDILIVDYINFPETDLFTDNRRDIGFGCSIKNDRNIYYVSSSKR